MNRSVKSATRVFDVLEVFERERRPLRVADLVQALDAPQSSVSMLLQTLISEGYIDFNPNTREYCPALRVAYMCDWVTQLPRSHPELIRQTMQTLAEQTSGTIMLGRIENLHMQYVSVVHPRQAVRFAICAGVKRPLHLSALGIVLMSMLADSQIGLMLRRYNAECAIEGKIASLPSTLREVVVARDQGYYQSGGLATPGAGVIAMVLPCMVRGKQLALGVGAPMDRLQREKSMIVDHLEKAISLFDMEQVAETSPRPLSVAVRY